MIYPGRNITLRPYKVYKNDHSKDEIIGYGEDKRGKFLKFQVMDVNQGKNKTNTGYAYVNVYTDLPLKVDDMVQIDKILYIQIKQRTFIMGITIKQSNPFVSEDANLVGDDLVMPTGVDF